MASTNNESETDTLPLDFYPARPAFMVPSPAATSARGLVLSGPASAKGQAGAKARSPVKEKEIWFAIKETIIDVFGDAGWALVGSSFNGDIHRPFVRQQILTSAYSPLLLTHHPARHLPRRAGTRPHPVGRPHLSARDRRAARGGPCARVLGDDQEGAARGDWALEARHGAVSCACSGGDGGDRGEGEGGEGVGGEEGDDRARVGQDGGLSG